MDQPISEIELEVMDIDWFAVDEDGALGHFTSGTSGLLPPSVISSKIKLEKVFSFISELPMTRKVQVDDKCEDIVSPSFWKRLSNPMEMFLECYLKMGSRELYSYDYYEHDPKNYSYFRVIIPEKPLLLDELPNDIQHILGKTILRGMKFAGTQEIGAMHVKKA